MIDWSRIDTVLLDMDGTILDLHFDSRFWLHEVPASYGRSRGWSRDEAWCVLEPRLKAVEGTLQWYCIDHWSRELGLDVLSMKHELAHLIRFRDGAENFLRALKRASRHTVLVTNAHPASLALKTDRTDLETLFDATVSSHDLGHPKEDPAFWPRLSARIDFDPSRTLFVDDSLPVLRAARAYGIAQLLAVRHPDSRGPLKDTGEFPALDRFEDIMPARSG